MAQWLWQFSGNTHATRIEDLDAQIAHAIAELRSEAPARDPQSVATTVVALALRLCAARVHAMKAKLLKARLDEMRGRRTADVPGLEEELATLGNTGALGILEELGVVDHPLIATSLARHGR